MANFLGRPVYVLLKLNMLSAPINKLTRTHLLARMQKKTKGEETATK